MKFIQIFVPVAILHLVVITVILLQPGCHVRKAPVPPDGDPAVPTRAVPSTTGDYQSTAGGRGSATSSANRRPPMRPINNGPVTSDLPPAFNADLPLGNEGPLLMPIQESDGSGNAPAAGMETYTVARGDTLSGIARRFGVTVKALRAANNLKGDTIRAGAKLLIPPAGDAARVSTTPAAVDTSGQVYEVKPGDNLSVIARRHGVSVAELKQLNGLTSDTIFVGQKLSVPEHNATFTPPPPPVSMGRSAANDGSTYTVQPGDTPITIARRLGVSYQELMRVNGITDPTRMKVGQVLLVPGSAGSPPPAPAPARPSVSPSVPAPSTVPLRIESSRPAVINGSTVAPADLEAQMDDVPVSPVEVVEPTGGEE